MLFKTLLKRCFIYLIIPILIAVISLIFLSRPTYTGALEFKHNLHPISIKRDDYGVPTIEGKTWKDAFYGIGFVHAQDRLWSINFKKLLFAGRISEIFGEETLAIDKLMRSISLERYSKYAVETLDPKVIEDIQIYVDGFNDAVSSMKVLPLEFWLTWSKPEPLKVVDVVNNLKGISFFLTFGYVFEILFAKLETVLGAKKVAELFPIESESYLWSNATILNDDDLMQTGIYEKLNMSKYLTTPSGQEIPEERRAPRVSPRSSPITHTNKDPAPANKKPVLTPEPVSDVPSAKKKVQIEQPGPGKGSNAWIIHGNHTTTGKPIVAGDPHLTNAMPCFWYNAAFITEDNYASGVTIPGLPFMAFGKTKDFSWVFTANLLDTGDLYNMTINDEKYYYEEEWIDLKKFPEEIYVRGRDSPVKYDVYESHHGVILDTYFMPFFEEIAHKPAPGETYAFAWLGYTKEDPTITAFHKGNTIAKSAKDIFEIFESAYSFYMNIHFATSNGDIGFLVLGRLPIRNSFARDVKTLDGSRKDNDWLGWVPWEDQPRVLNPKKGYIVSANNKVTTDNVKWQVSLRSMPTSRAARIEEMITDFIKNGKKISVNDVKAMQLDVLDIVAREVAPVMIKCVREALRLGYKVSIIDQSKINKMINTLEQWDYRMEKESIAASIQSVWEFLFKNSTLLSLNLEEDPRKSLLNDKIYDNFISLKIISWASLEEALFDEYWCHNEDNKGKPNPCLYSFVKALEETWIYLENALGKDFDKWQWQNLHYEEYPHAPFSDTPLKPFFHRSLPNSGNARTVKVSFVAKGGFKGVWSPNMRMVVSTDNSEASYAILDTGISESPTSKHFDDQMKAYQEGKWLKMQEGPLKEWEDKMEIKFKN